jgi:4-coumarate--CoA ligase
MYHDFVSHVYSFKQCKTTLFIRHNKSYIALNLVQGYAMTESAAVATRGFNTPKRKKYNSIGFLAPNMYARIVDMETGCPMPPGSCGELWLHGPAVMQGMYVLHLSPKL